VAQDDIENVNSIFAVGAGGFRLSMSQMRDSIKRCGPPVHPISSHLISSEKDTKLAQKLGQLQPYMARNTTIKTSAFLLECIAIGQLASFGPT
jgi:hypothetical protein